MSSFAFFSLCACQCTPHGPSHLCGLNWLPPFLLLRLTFFRSAEGGRTRKKRERTAHSTSRNCWSRVVPLRVNEVLSRGILTLLGDVVVLTFTSFSFRARSFPLFFKRILLFSRLDGNSQEQDVVPTPTPRRSMHTNTSLGRQIDGKIGCVCARTGQRDFTHVA